MKKRVRKKLRKAEFKEVGCSIKITVDEESIEQILDELTSLATDNGMHFIGGGLGYIVLPPKENKNSIVPRKPAFLVESLASFPFLFTDFIIGYLINAEGRMLTDKQTAAIKQYVASLSVEHDINMKCDLWN